MCIAIVDGIGLFLPDQLKAAHVGVEKAAPLDATQMKYRSQVAVGSINMLVDKHLIIESKDRVIERCLVQAKLDTWHIA